MTMPIPADHAVGDPGHTTDHNAIVTTLTTMAADIVTLQAQGSSSFSSSGGNTCNIPGTATSFAVVNLPGGNRDTAADALDVNYGGTKVFSLNGYGELRVYPGLPSHVVQAITALAGQTGDLLQFLTSTSAVLARFSSAGVLVVPSVQASQPGLTAATPETWHALSLQNGFTADQGNNQPAPAYRMGPDSSVCFRGAIVTPGSGGTGVTLATLPAGYRPGTYWARWSVISASGNTNGHGYIRPDGTVQLEGSFGGNFHMDITGRTTIDGQ